jgi:hypothetical protein
MSAARSVEAYADGFSRFARELQHSRARARTGKVIAAFAHLNAK